MGRFGSLLLVEVDKIERYNLRVLLSGTVQYVVAAIVARLGGGSEFGPRDR